jgi:molybdopterin-guanine dinucleotide biosynthesis protein A
MEPAISVGYFRVPKFHRQDIFSNLNTILVSTAATVPWVRGKQTKAYHQTMQSITAFVLVGGKSTRMGRDKAFVDIAGHPLISHVLMKASAITKNVKIVGDPQKFRQFGEVVSDLYLNCGPLAGIHAALASTNTDWNLVLGVDLPFLTANLLHYLVRESQRSKAMVTVPSVGGHLHPLSAVYRREFHTHADRALRSGKNKIDALFPQVRTRVINEKELAAAGFKAHAFRNLNTPEEWAEAKHEFKDEQR